MKINNQLNDLPVDVKIFSLCHKETLFQADFQQYKWKLGSLLSQKNFDLTHFGRLSGGRWDGER